MNLYDFFCNLLKENGPFIIDAIDRKANPQISLSFEKADFSDGTEALKIKQLIYLRPYKEIDESVTPIVFNYYLNNQGDIIIDQNYIQTVASERLSSEDVGSAVQHVIWDLNYPWNYIYQFEPDLPNPTLHNCKYINSGLGTDFIIRPYSDQAIMYDLWHYSFNRQQTLPPSN